MSILRDLIRGKRGRRPPCSGEHEFKDGWEFCLRCGWYKREIPKAKGGDL